MSLHTDIDVFSKVNLLSKLDEDQTIHLKAIMNYYFQVQGQIAILNLPRCGCGMDAKRYTLHYFVFIMTIGQDSVALSYIVCTLLPELVFHRCH